MIANIALDTYINRFKHNGVFHSMDHSLARYKKLRNHAFPEACEVLMDVVVVSREVITPPLGIKVVPITSIKITIFPV